MKTLALVLSMGVAASAYAIVPSVGDITDSRTTGNFFARLEVELKLTGDEMADVKGIRTRITKATDDTGRDIINPEKASTDFEPYGENSFGGGGMKLEFKNPARKAAAIQTVAGEIDLYIPKNDPAASVKIDNFLTQAGKPITNPGLKAAKIDLVVMDKAAYEADQKKKAEEAKAKAKAEGMPADMLANFENMFGGFGGFDENSLAFKISDPEQRIVSMEVFDAAGQKIDNNGSMTSSDTKTLYYSQKVPANASLVINVATAKAITKVPLQLANVALP